MNSLKRKERDLSAVKSELESKTKQLEEKTKQDGELVKKFVSIQVFKVFLF